MRIQYAFLVAGLGLALAAPTHASAASLLAPASAADTGAAAGKGAKIASKYVVRSRVVTVNTDELTRHVAPLGRDRAADRVARAKRLDGVVTIDLFPDVSATFQRTDIDTVGDSGYAWNGNVNGINGQWASLIIENGRVTGMVYLDRKTYRIEPLGNGLHRVTEIDANKLPEDAVKEVPPSKASKSGPRSALDVARAAGDTKIRVLAAFTANAQAEDPDIKADIKLAISLANQAYKASEMGIKLILADTVRTTYDETAPDDFFNNINDLDGSNGSVLSKVRTKRNKLKADVVSLWRQSNEQGICGIANLTDFPDATNTSDFAYSVMNWLCVSNLSFHHEIGHNMGLRHDRFVDPNEGVGYNHGYTNTTDDCWVRSVMAYNNACSNAGGFCNRVNMFSSKAFKWKVSANKKCKLGNVNNNNTRRGKETKGEISTYKTGAPADAADEEVAATH